METDDPNCAHFWWWHRNAPSTSEMTLPSSYWPHTICCTTTATLTAHIRKMTGHSFIPIVYVSVVDLALDSVRSYLSHRQQHVSVAGARSKSQELNQGVAQGSVFSPILFSIYTLSLGVIVRKHGKNLHLCGWHTVVSEFQQLRAIH